MKKSCIYIDQRFHEKTGSTNFLISVLERSFDVRRHFLNGFSLAELETLRTLDADLFVVFQYDFLAPLLLSLNKRVLVVPMFDGTGEIFEEHWLLQKTALILNFSRVLHNRHQVLGLNSFYAQAFPSPASGQDIRSRYHAPRYFFWERRPQSGLSARWLADQLKQKTLRPEFVHLHLAPDPGQTSSVQQQGAHSLFSPIRVETTTWFPKRAEMTAALERCNVYVAPRPSEGIGWSFLEAMANGMLVLSKAAPTMTEYISNWQTGILVGDELPDIDASTVRRIGAAAADFVTDGHKRWVSSQAELVDVVYDYALKQPEKVDYTFDEVSMLPTMFFWSHAEYAARIRHLVAHGSIEKSDKKRIVRRIEMSLLKHPQLAAYAIALHARWKERNSGK